MTTIVKNTVRLLTAGALAIVLYSPSPSFAISDNLTLVQEPAQTVGPQSTSNPCIIAATTCQQPAGFAYNNFVSSGAISSYNESQSYTVQNIRDHVGNTFWVAIDVNTTSAASEILLSFTATITPPGGVQFQYTGGGNIGAVSSNGNGYADWTLRQIDLTSYDANAIVTFNAQWNNAVDGGESFFLIPTVCTGSTCVPVPEPSALILLGAGLVVVAVFAQRKFRRN